MTSFAFTQFTTTLLLEAALRSSVPLAVALLACVLLRDRSAALRHRILTAAVILAAAVVPLSMIMPSWGIPLMSAAASSPTTQPLLPAIAAVSAAVSDNVGDNAAAISTAGVAPAALVEAGQLLLLIWLIGVAIGSAALLLGALRLARLTAGAAAVVDGRWRQMLAETTASYGIRRPIALLTVPSSALLATWGLVRPRVVLPAQALTWSEERVRVVLRHELAHIKRGDWAVQVAAEVLRTIFWFNPLLWLACARLRHEGEYACDDAVLGTGVAGDAYATHLVEIVKACRRPASGWVPAMSIARPSTLERRITAMLNIRLNRQAPTLRATAIVLAALACIALPAASFDLWAQTATPRPLSGSVYDASGSVLPGVEVALTDEQQVKWSAVTDAKGAFEFTPVGAGKYVLEATLPGFRTLHNDVTLENAKDWTRNITMQVGQLQETITVTGKRPAQRAAVPVPSSSGPVRVGGNIKAPQKLLDVHPIYPAAMQQAGLEGVVPIDALIGLDGHVVSVRVVSAQVHPAFARAAEQAVRQWVFTQTLLNGMPVEVEMTVSVKFSLED